MTSLKLGPLMEDKPVRIAIELPADIHRDLVAYAEAHSAVTGQPPVSPDKLVAPMLRYFLANDRGFAKARRAAQAASKPG